MRNRKPYEDDDGRTIVDMSEVDPMPTLLPRFKRKREAEPSSRQPMSKEDRRVILVSAVGAALLIGAVFVVAAAVVIGLMIAAWT